MGGLKLFIVSTMDWQGKENDMVKKRKEHGTELRNYGG